MSNHAKVSIKSLKSKTFCLGLDARPDPYFEETSIEPGLYLGLRKGSKRASWVARQRVEGTSQKTVTIGVFGSMTYDEAKAAARKAGEEKRDGIGLSDIKTVAQAVGAYFKSREAAIVRLSREDLDKDMDEFVRALKVTSAQESLKRDTVGLTNHVLSKPIAKMQIKDVTDKVLAAWRDALFDLEAKKRGEDKPLGNASKDRYLKAFRAALNYSAREFDTVGLGQTLKWNAVKRVGKDKAREGNLSKDQRFALANACEADLRPLIYVLAQLPVRPNALAALRVKNMRDNDGKGELFVYDIKIKKFRWVALTDHLYSYMQEQAKGKAEGDLLFSTHDGRMWTSDLWKARIVVAREKAGLPEESVTYLLRHGVLSDMIHGGSDGLTAAKMGGTSLMQIDKHYGKADMEIARGHLENLTPT